MSYARWADDCDVYVYASDGGFTCNVTDGKYIHVKTRSEMIDYLHAIADLGKAVPKDVIDALSEELKELGEYNTFLKGARR